MGHLQRPEANPSLVVALTVSASDPVFFPFALAVSPPRHLSHFTSVEPWYGCTPNPPTPPHAVSSISDPTRCIFDVLSPAHIPASPCHLIRDQLSNQITPTPVLLTSSFTLSEPNYSPQVSIRSAHAKTTH